MDAVVIGRNEGARLLAGLEALAGQVRRVVYVDSGSTDGSAEAAPAMGAQVVDLDLALPFTAARARNAGASVLLAAPDAPDFLQFLDGDCALRAGWVATARAFMEANPQVGVVCGRRRERFPERSVYNLLCDREWDTPVGPARACGGDALMRTTAFSAVGGFDPTFIAGEEPELCERLRRAGWQIWRLDAEMTWHDAAILRFGQWWRRSVRAGHAYAQVGARHPSVFVADRRRIWVWGLALPLLALVSLYVAPALVAGIALLYALSFGRVAWRFRKQGLPVAGALGCAGLITLSKFPNLVGMATYFRRRLRGTGHRLIEYK